MSSETPLKKPKMITSQTPQSALLKRPHSPLSNTQLTTHYQSQITRLETNRSYLLSTLKQTQLDLSEIKNDYQSLKFTSEKKIIELENEASVLKQENLELKGLVKGLETRSKIDAENSSSEIIGLRKSIAQFKIIIDDLNSRRVEKPVERPTVNLDQSREIEKLNEKIRLLQSARVNIELIKQENLDLKRELNQVSLLNDKIVRLEAENERLNNEFTKWNGFLEDDTSPFTVFSANKPGYARTLQTEMFESSLDK